jgi:hypothetical protein
VGPDVSYAIGHQIGVVIESEYVVPSLPEQFDITQQVFHGYLSIYWRSNIAPGYVTQFVPRLMLGKALVNSTPEFDPELIQLDTWYIGAQYFMALCDDEDREDKRFCENDHYIPKVMTGKLIPVKPGEGILTSIGSTATTSSSSSVEWYISMMVIGDLTRVSTITVDRPFMGLVPNTTSWLEDIYEEVYVGSCLVTDGMNNSKNYPSFWKMDMSVQMPEGASHQPMWEDWTVQQDV